MLHRPFAAGKVELCYGGPVAGNAVAGLPASADELRRAVAALPTIRLVGSRSERSEALMADTAVALETSDFYVAGGAGNKVLEMVAEGAANVYAFASDGMSKWDTCGPEAILAALGGRTTDCRGAPIAYPTVGPMNNAAGVVMTLNPDLHDTVVAAMGPVLDRHASG